MTTTGLDPTTRLDSAAQVLEFARLRRADADRAERDVFIAAVIWAEQHPPESIGLGATWHSPAGDTGLSIAGPGAPEVSEFCIPEFAAAIGRSTNSGREVLADALEVKHRLPRLWRRVLLAGDPDGVPVWRARRIAQHTQGLSREAATFVDAQVAPYAHKIGIAALERLVAEAIARFMPERPNAALGTPRTSASSRSTTGTCPSTAPPASRASSTSRTRSTSTTP